MYNREENESWKLANQRGEMNRGGLRELARRSKGE